MFLYFMYYYLISYDLLFILLLIHYIWILDRIILSLFIDIEILRFSISQLNLIISSLKSHAFYELCSFRSVINDFDSLINRFPHEIELIQFLKQIISLFKYLLYDNLYVHIQYWIKIIYAICYVIVFGVELLVNQVLN